MALIKKVLTVVLPTFNEKDNVLGFIEKLFDQEKKNPGWKYEIIVADSKSKDGTAEVVKDLEKKNSQVHYLEVGPGIGVGLIEGHRYALSKFKPDVMAQMDADGQVEADVLPRLVKTIEDGFDLALGSRMVEGGKNNLSFSRRLFTNGSSLLCRILMGPWDIKEFTNSARAFTPKLFQKINLERLPWKERTFINQPAFLNEAVLAGAKYKEVPLIFKDRESGYSKNKTVNYTYDVITYAIDARLYKWGFDIPFFKMSRRIKTLIKFGVVGFSGTIVDFIFYNIFISYFQIRPATSKGLSTEIAIFNNFALNHMWTFKNRKTRTNVYQKFGIFNLVSLGGLAVAVLIVKFLHEIFGDGYSTILGLRIPYYNLYFFATIPPVLIWNFTANHFITWRSKAD
jgi:dolichol-phosphate mannosyltransferase